MNTGVGPYRVVDFPPGRRIWVNTLELSWPAHTMYGLLEVDVTVARKLIAEHKTRTGETLSFAGFLTYCLARAVDEDKSIQAHRKGSPFLGNWLTSRVSRATVEPEAQWLLDCQQARGKQDQERHQLAEQPLSSIQEQNPPDDPPDHAGR